MGFELIDGKVPNEKVFYVPSYLMESLQAEDGKPDAQSSLLLEKRKEMASACPSFTVLLPWMDKCMGVRCLELRDTEILLEEFVTGSATSTQVMARCDLLWKYYDQGEFAIKERSPMESAGRWFGTFSPQTSVQHIIALLEGHPIDESGLSLAFAALVLHITRRAMGLLWKDQYLFRGTMENAATLGAIFSEEEIPSQHARVALSIMQTHGYYHPLFSD